MNNNLSKIFMTIFICLFFVFLVADLYASTKKGYAIARIEHFSNAINRFHKDVGRYPSNNEGLKILIEKPKDVANWKGPYLPYPIIPTDPWNNEYIYIFPAVFGYKPFNLYSFGPNGIDDKGQKDDLANWKLIK